MATTTGIFSMPKAANIKPPKASLDTIMKLAGGICGGVLVKDYAAYKKLINKWETIQKFYGPWGAIKLQFTFQWLEFH